MWKEFKRDEQKERKKNREREKEILFKYFVSSEWESVNHFECVRFKYFSKLVLKLKLNYLLDLQVICNMPGEKKKSTSTVDERKVK